MTRITKKHLKDVEKEIKRGHIASAWRGGDKKVGPDISPTELFKEVGKAGADKGELALGKNGDVYALSWDYPHGKKGIKVWWRKTNVKEKDVTELFTGDLSETTSVAINKPFLRLYRSEAEAKEQGRKKRKRSRADAELNVWVGEVRSGLNVGPPEDALNPNRFGVKFKDFSYDYTTRVIREMVDKTSIKNQSKPKPKPKEKVIGTVIGTAPKSTGIKMF